MLFLHSTHHHAEMTGFDHYADTLWLNGFLNGLGNLRGQSFLNLQAAGKYFNEPWNFAQADNFAIRNVGHVYLAKERQHVVLAETKHFDVLDDDHLVVGDCEQGLLKHGLGVFFVALDQMLIGAVNSLGSTLQPLAGRVFAEDARSSLAPDLQNWHWSEM